MLMVQIKSQYQFLYDVMLDQLMERCSGMLSETDHDAESEPDSKRQVSKKFDDAMSDAAWKTRTPAASDKLQ